MRIISLLPSATDIIFELGLGEELVGVSDDCNWPAEVRGLPQVARTKIDVSNLTAAQIEAVVTSESASHSLYSVDSALMAKLAPDLVITQDVCTVCAVSSGDLATACPIGTPVYSMNPRRLDDVFSSVEQLSMRLGAPQRGQALAQRLCREVSAVKRLVAAVARPRVFVAEWMEPPYGSGHWLPDMVETAGGVNLLSAPGEYSFATSWDAVLEADPALIVIAACGFSLEQSMLRLGSLRLPVRTVVVDGDSYYSRPGPRVVAGVRQLAHLLHPALVGDPGLPLAELPRSELAA